MLQYNVKLTLRLKDVYTKIWFKFHKYFQKEMQEFSPEVGKPAKKCYSYNFRGMFKQFYLESKTHFSDFRDYTEYLINSQKTKLIVTMFLSLLQWVKINTWKCIQCILSFASETQLCKYRMMKSLFENRTCSHNSGDLTIICRCQKDSLDKLSDHRKQYFCYAPL